MKSSPVYGAARVNLVFGLANIVVAAVSSIALARFLPTEMFVDYATMTALISWAMLLFELGANSGFSWMLKEARDKGAGGTLYRTMRLHRWLLAPPLALIAVTAGPVWAQASGLSETTWTQATFLVLAGVVVLSLQQQLCYYALISDFRHNLALTWTQILSIIRSVGLVVAALCFSDPAALALVLLGVAGVSALIFTLNANRLLKDEGAKLQPGAIISTYRHGFATFLDKTASSVSSGPFLLIFLASHFERVDLALLVVANDFLQKAISTANIPLGNMVMPYLNATRGEAAFVASVRKVGALALLVLGIAMAAVGVFSLNGIAMLYGTRYQSAWLPALIMVFPLFGESWTRMVAGFAVITSGKYQDIARVNIAKLIASIALLFLTFPYGLEIVLIGQGLVQLTSSAIVLALARGLRLLDRSVVPKGFLPSVIPALVAGLLVQLPLPEHSPFTVFAGMAVFCVVLLVCARMMIRLDHEVWSILSRLAGARATGLFAIFFLRPEQPGPNL